MKAEENREPSIVIKGLDDDTAAYMRGRVESFLKAERENQDLDLDSLESIILTDDFEQELSSISDELNEPIDYMDEEFAVSMAKTIQVVRKGKLTTILVLNVGFRVPFSCGYEDTMFFFLHVFHHELCHVHDFSIQHDLFKGVRNIYEFLPAERFFYRMARAVWQEYFCSKNSVSSLVNRELEQKVVLTYIGSMVDAVCATTQRMDEAIRDYRTDSHENGTMNLFNKTVPQAAFLIKSFAYVHGYLAGLHKGMGAFSPEAEALLGQSAYWPIWLECGRILEDMAGEYPRWSISVVYAPLMELIDTYFKDMGLEFTNTDDGELYLSVSFSPGTTKSG